ncbi:MAG: C45 family autoproteolytic acyltransferase/hydrolase [Desulfosarcinaceae bacterium]|jgi:isopenicillin-N N-acyltransferase-like protein
MGSHLLTVVECRGSAREAGRQYGEACRKSVHNAVEVLTVIQNHGPIPVGRDRIEAAALKYLPAAEAYDPDTIAFIRGQAQGAGLDFGAVLALHCLLEVMVNYQNLAALCTSFAVGGALTRDGGPLIGQNVDWHPDAPVDLARIHREDGGRLLALFLCGVPYYTLTSAGLANCANMTLNMQQCAAPHLPVGLYLPRVLRQPDASSAVAQLKTVATGLAFFLFADAGGGILGLESVANRHQVIEPQNGVVAHANHYETAAFQSGDLYPHVVPCSPARSRRMRSLIEGELTETEDEALTAETMMAILRDHQGYPHSICRHVDPHQTAGMPSLTNASIVMLPREGRMFVAAGPPCENDYQRFRV